MADKIEYKVDIDTTGASDAVDDLGNSLTGLGGPIGALAGLWGKVTAGIGGATKGLKSFKAAFIATGIGALVIAVVALGTAFASTQRGADAISKSLVPLRSQMQGLWGDIQNLVTGQMKLDDFFSGFNDRQKEYLETGALIDKRSKDIRDSNIELTKSLAFQNKEYQTSMLIAADASLADEERVAAAERANKILKISEESKQALLSKRIQLLRDEQALNDTDKEGELELANLIAERYNNEAQLQAALKRGAAVIATIRKQDQAELDAAQQTRHDNEIQRLITEQEANNALSERQDADLIKKGAEQRAIWEAEDKRRKENDKWEALAKKKRAKAYKESKAQRQRDKAAAAADAEAQRQLNEETAMSGLNAIGQIANAADADSVAAKGIAAIQAGINTYEGVSKAFAQGGALGFITGGLIATAGALSVKNILSTNIPKRSKKGGGGGGSVSAPIPAAPAATIPDIQSFDEIYSDGIELDKDTVGGNGDKAAVRAYVVLDDINEAENESNNIDENSSL